VLKNGWGVDNGCQELAHQEGSLDGYKLRLAEYLNMVQMIHLFFCRRTAEPIVPIFLKGNTITKI
jgi:hypothetical protein